MSENLVLKDQVAIITGGGTGIGLAIVTEMAKEGAHVVVASRNMENLKRAVEKVIPLGRSGLAVPADVRKEEDVENMVQKTMDQFGRIDILVNNAGGSFRCPLEDMSPKGWDAVININLRGTFLCCRAAGRVMIKQRRGNIINIASIGGRDGYPFSAHYGASKAAVINLTKSLSVEWARYHIRVNCIAPGPVITKGFLEAMKKAGLSELPKSPHASGRWGKPEEIARVALFLASESSSYIVGETLYVDGGPYRWEGGPEPKD
jgi:NAD(P)-dependent dehydrogenase (short-subunit alcohol dehydrogenase family)